MLSESRREKLVDRFMETGSMSWDDLDRERREQDAEAKAATKAARRTRWVEWRNSRDMIGTLILIWALAWSLLVVVSVAWIIAKAVG